jgi:exosortase C (VPDSG-CTERM-specific)
VSDLNSSLSRITTIGGRLPRRLKLFGFFAAGLSLVFAGQLFELVRFAAESGLHSYVLLIPFIAAYLIWLKRKLTLPEASASPTLALAALALGSASLVVLWVAGAGATPLPASDSLALSTFSYLCFLLGGAFLFLGGGLLRQFAFPTALLIFMVPMPAAVENAVEIFFQHASAKAAALLFSLTGSTVFHHGLIFHLPGISIEDAQECSGIRSTVVLFITSLIAGHLILNSPWRRALLTLFVIPLAIARNAFRIFTIAMLCVHVDPSMIDSPIHHRGGPLFFVLSLLPFLVLLLWFRRRENSKAVSRSDSI